MSRISDWHWKNAFNCTETVNNYVLKRGKVCQICEIYFPIFSENILTVLQICKYTNVQIFSNYGLRKLR